MLVRILFTFRNGTPAFLTPFNRRLSQERGFPGGGEKTFSFLDSEAVNDIGHIEDRESGFSIFRLIGVIAGGPRLRFDGRGPESGARFLMA